MAIPRVYDDNYYDIINLNYPEPRNQTRMTMHQHAAHFSLFAALSGQLDVVKEAYRLTDRKIELDEFMIEMHILKC